VWNTGKGETKMKTIVLIALIAVLALSGCASSCKGCYIMQDWVDFWKNPGSGNEEYIMKDFIDFWRNPCE